MGEKEEVRIYVDSQTVLANAAGERGVVSCMIENIRFNKGREGMTSIINQAIEKLEAERDRRKLHFLFKEHGG